MNELEFISTYRDIKKQIALLDILLRPTYVSKEHAEQVEKACRHLRALASDLVFHHTQ